MQTVREQLLGALDWYARDYPGGERARAAIKRAKREGKCPDGFDCPCFKAGMERERIGSLGGYLPGHEGEFR